MDQFYGSTVRWDQVEPTTADGQLLWQPQNAVRDWIAMLVVIEQPSVKSTLGQDGLNADKVQTDKPLLLESLLVCSSTRDRGAATIHCASVMRCTFFISVMVSMAIAREPPLSKTFPVALTYLPTNGSSRSR
jgi:hypothetical protein